jgi:hypothetical protein
MICPNCKSEYRPGFTSCSDCGVELVEVLPPPIHQDPEARENERPDLARTSHFLAWFLPMLVLVVLFFGVSVRPGLMGNVFFAVSLFCLMMLANLGSYWMLYQSVRYEKRVGRHALLSFVPFMFVWYSLVRVPLRKEFQGDSEFIR